MFRDLLCVVLAAGMEPSPLLSMASSGMLRCVALVRTDVSEEFSASFIKVSRIGERGTTLAVTSAKFPRNVDSYKSHTT
jgi:hypothetical protein